MARWLTDADKDDLARAWAQYEADRYNGAPIPDDVWAARRQAWLRETAWLAEAVSPLIQRHRRLAAAEALRSAADAVGHFSMLGALDDPEQFLRVRADRIEQEDER